MIYVTPFFQRFYPDCIQIDSDKLDQIVNASAVAVDIYTCDFHLYYNTVDNLLKKTKELHLYLGEPTDQKELINFVNKFDLPNVYFYSDCVLNCTLKNAKFTTTVNWFIDPVNYYTKYQWAKDLIGKLKFNYSKPYLFDSLLGQQKPHRDKINQLISSSQFKHLFVHSYFKNNMSNGIHWNQNINLNAHTLTSELFQINGEDARPSALLPVDIYNLSYYSIVCETTSFNSYNQYTEKVAKPIVAQRPFISFAGQYYMKNLRSLGFKTFDIIIDESYDSEPNEDVRYRMAWHQVEWLCQQDPTYIFNQTESILLHNQQHFLNTDWAQSFKNLFNGQKERQ